VKSLDRRDIDNIRRRVVNIEKARRMLHWVPQVRMQRGLDFTAEWFLEAGFGTTGSEAAASATAT
jgi:UDP-glucose 4-epimerase